MVSFSAPLLSDNEFVFRITTPLRSLCLRTKVCLSLHKVVARPRWCHPFVLCFVSHIFLEFFNEMCLGTPHIVRRFGCQEIVHIAIIWSSFGVSSNVFDFLGGSRIKGTCLTRDAASHDQLREGEEVGESVSSLCL